MADEDRGKSVTDIYTEIDQYRNQHTGLVNALSAEQEKTKQLETQLTDLRSQLEKVDATKVAELTYEKARLDDELVARNVELAKAKADLETTDKKVEDINSKLQHLIDTETTLSPNALLVLSEIVSPGSTVTHSDTAAVVAEGETASVQQETVSG